MSRLITHTQHRMFCLLVVGLILCGFESQLGLAAVVRLRSSVTVENTILKLGDVADVFDDDADFVESLKAISLQPAPAPGLHARLNLDLIRDRMRAHGVDPSQVDFNGSITIMVTRKPDSPLGLPHRPFASVPHRVITTASQDSQTGMTNVSKTRDSHPELNLSTKQHTTARQMVIHAIEDELARSGQDWGKPSIFIRLTPTQVLEVLSAVDGLRVADGKVLSDERFEVVIAFQTADGRSESVRVIADIKQRPRVLAAKYTIARGALITKSDVELKEVDDERNGVTDPQLVIGKEARNEIRAGVCIKADAVVEPLMIRKGDLCDVVTRVAGTQVSAQCRALKDGRLGDSIGFETSDRRDPLYARVVGVKQAETAINPKRPINSVQPNAVPAEDAEFDLVAKPVSPTSAIPSVSKSFALTEHKALPLHRSSAGTRSTVKPK